MRRMWGTGGALKSQSERQALHVSAPKRVLYSKTPTVKSWTHTTLFGDCGIRHLLWIPCDHKRYLDETSYRQLFPYILIFHITLNASKVPSAYIMGPMHTCPIVNFILNPERIRWFCRFRKQIWLHGIYDDLDCTGTAELPLQSKTEWKEHVDDAVITLFSFPIH